MFFGEDFFFGGEMVLFADGGAWKVRKNAVVLQPTPLPLSRCAAATGVFTPVVLQMINVGEETGELDSLLFEIAEMYERDTDYAIKGLSASIEPILLAVIGVLVLLLALGVFLPLWNLGQAAMGHAGG